MSIRQGGLVGFAVWQTERKGGSQARRTRGRVRFIATEVPPDVEEAFVVEGARRGMSKDSIARRILEIVADDNLFEAVLGEHE